MINIVRIKSTKRYFYVIIKNDMLLFDDYRIRFSISTFNDILDFIKSPKKWVPAKEYIGIKKLKESNNFKIMCEFDTFDELRKIESTHPEFFI